MQNSNTSKFQRMEDPMHFEWLASSNILAPTGTSAMGSKAISDLEKGEQENITTVQERADKYQGLDADPLPPTSN